MRIKSVILSVFIGILFFTLSFSAFADDFSDTKEITWEKIKEPFFDKYNPFGTGARSIGMGEAFVAIADDASTVYYNPAGLAQMDHNEIFWTGGTYYEGVPYTGFGTFSMALGGQFFAVSYQKLYHPIGWYPSTVYIPRLIGNSVPGNLYYTHPLTFGNGLYNWFGGNENGGLDPSQQEFLAEKYRDYINLPFQTNSVLLSYATPLTGDKSFLFGLNVKYTFTDADMKNVLTDDYDAWAWGLDIGFIYKLRIIEFLKDFNIGIMLRDVSGTYKYHKSGIEKNLFFTSTIALSMRTTELIQKEVTSFSVDFDSVNDPGVLEAEKYRLKMGFEQWFIDSHFGIRFGFVDFLHPSPWRFSVGLSARYIMGIDYSYVRAVPFNDLAENEEESHWISVHWEWGKVKRILPTPDVFASVEPISFSPRNGEVALFKLNAYSKAGMDRWALNILDKKNNLVKSYVDIGMPPSQIVWNGTDNKYVLMPDGEYTFIFEATDKLGSTASTPVQTVKLFTPVLEAQNKTALLQLKELLNKIKERDMAEDAAVKVLAENDLVALKKEKAQPTPVDPAPPAALPAYANPFALAAAPAQGNQGAQQAGQPQQGPVNIVGFPNIDSGAISSAFISTDTNDLKSFNMEYNTLNTLPKYVIQEMALMIRSIAESMGGSVDQIGINAVYGGSNNMSLNVPKAQARNFSKGIISVDQMLRGASVTLNGEAIYPNF